MESKSSGEVTVQQRIPMKRVMDLLCEGFESGSYGTFRIVGKVAPKGDPATWPNRMDDPARPDSVVYGHIDYPVNKGGSVTVEVRYNDDLDEHGKPRRYVLNLKAVTEGLQKFAEVEPGRFAEFMTENDDAITGDYFLQVALLGKVVYG